MTPRQKLQKSATRLIDARTLADRHEAEIRAALTALTEEHGSQRKLAMEFGCSDSHLSDVRSGARAVSSALAGKMAGV